MFFTDYLSKTPIEEFGAMFGSFKTEAFRLEALQRYDVPEEDAAFRSFVKNPKAKLPEGLNGEWHDLLKSAAQRNAKFRRLRIVTSPPTEYVKFEVSWGYSQSIKYGEEILVLPVTDFAELIEAKEGLVDFWMFDDTSAFVMGYDLRGRFLGVWKADSHLTAALHATKVALLRRATLIERSDYASLLAS